MVTYSELLERKRRRQALLHLTLVCLLVLALVLMASVGMSDAAMGAGR